MSDSLKDLAKQYDKNVFIVQHPRSIGLFPIPEYPELEPKRGMWSSALEAILTTLRYLAPATLLTLFWGQQSFLFKLLKHIDSAFRAIVFSSEEQKLAVLKWLGEAGSVRVENLETVWRHGWIVCGVLDAALPGACAGHPPTKLSLKHAQSIADHYLGVEPVFSRQELESNGPLSKHQEWKLGTYLDRIRQSLSKLTPPVSKPTSRRTSPETTQFTLDYVAKGSGLAAAQVNNKSCFKIYPTSQQSLDPGEITILIRGPKDTYGMFILPPILGKAQLIRQKLLGLDSKPNYTESVLPITQGATYLRSYGKNDMNKTYHIPKTTYDIKIESEARGDHIKVSYIVKLEGKYDISITSRGQGIVGSPFTATASKNIFRVLENESFCLEDGEEIDIVDIETDRKVVLRIVDFVTEKMLLKENGSLEKISDDEAKILMVTAANAENECESIKMNTSTKLLTEHNKMKNRKTTFNNIVNKVIIMNRVCKIFNEICHKNKRMKSDQSLSQLRGQQDITDIVNSTFSEKNINPLLLADVRNKYIIPENISVSIRTEKPYQTEVIKNNEFAINLTPKETVLNEIVEDPCPESNLILYNNVDDDILMVISSSPNNPFLDDSYDDNYSRINDLGTYVTTEYETNNYQNEEIPDSPIKILIEENFTPTEIVNSNPFIEADVIQLERPKTPVYKIISGEVQHRDDSVYVDKKTEQLNEEMMANEFINPFFIHQHHQSNQIKESLPITDFIIGAPVSLPPIIRASSPIPHMESLIITGDGKETKIIEDHDAQLYETKMMSNDESSSVFSTPMHTNLPRAGDVKINHSTASSPFQSLDSNLTEDVEIISVSDNQLEQSQIEVSDKDLSNIKPKKEIWDSAYVSIDDNNSSPDSNNNDNSQLSETLSKQKFSPSDVTFGIKREELYNMGPAERELWQTCNELSDIFTIDESNNIKWDAKRPIFTPILEESDRSISTGMKDTSKNELFPSNICDSDLVTVAFAELNNIYHDNFPNLETESTTTINENNKLHSLEVDFTIHTNDTVDSASEIITDVKRQTNNFEGKISEVQPNVTESVSVSPLLQGHEKSENYSTTDNHQDVQFGDSHTNIVLERKKYWDDRIRQIEAKSQETTTLQKKRKISLKYLRQNDSLTKRRGKQIVKNFLSTGDIDKSPNKIIKNNHENVTSQDTILKSELDSDDGKENVKLVGKWKKYWDDKLETEIDESDVSCFKVKSTKCKLQTSPYHNSKVSLEDIHLDITQNVPPVKQELPEEVYKAFETSPKRFFGTSRKQILNKIDTFLGKPNTEDNSSPDVTSVNPDSGLVSSRISLFHSITNTEELAWNQHKSKSMHSIFIKNPSVGDTNSFDEQLTDELPKDTVKNIVNEDTKPNHYKAEETSKQTIKEKRSRIAYNAFNQSFDETTYLNSNQKLLEIKPENTYVKNTIKCFSKPEQRIQKSKNTNELRRKSFSKSEMDIFNKITNKESSDDIDKYKSCDELPKINVKNFITLYEDVSKNSVESQKSGRIRTISTGLQNSVCSSSHLGTVNKKRVENQYSTTDHKISRSVPSSLPSKRNWINKSFESVSSSGTDTKTNTDSIDVEIIHAQEKESTFLSLSDIELEIVESNTDKSSPESTPEREMENVKKEYKSRFKMAKEFFQSLEELRDTKKPRQLNECELLLENKSAEKIESQGPRPPKRVKRKIKAHSLPSSEISKIWKQYQEKTKSEAGASKLVKISEKFNVDDLFTDVTEGKLSRQGSLRGIPHKKAVLETFRSMENLTDSKMSPYDTVVSEINDIVKEKEIKNAQTYLSEYPYLPTTDPSKYHSRDDTKASGLITLKELLNQRPRRNSVPDLRLNPTFTVNL